VLWGTGNAKREFIVSTDLADACHHLFEINLGPEIINVGSGKDISIRDLANMIAQLSGYKGGILWDTTKPDGMPRKVLDISRIEKTGWTSSISLASGLQMLIDEYTNFLD
jgi:GDP-L-fucose synthase